ncbi:MAG: hypothetical protein APF80_00565 [Alphaproteobacteria bacterium BRH_c36]|nr:MAG: hypothetical protein APF80_00565 [Alphaproteobacteria bacterium BRH_c36]
MAHALRLFAGPLMAMRVFEQASPHARIFALRPASDLFVVPLDDAVQDDLHRLAGTGDWLEEGPRISTGDMAFAARASQGAAVAYLETHYSGGAGEQSAVLWKDGRLVLGPLTMALTAARRPRSLWPVNAALRGLGVRTEGPQFADEFDAFGLGEYRSHDDIAADALFVPPRTAL